LSFQKNDNAALWANDGKMLKIMFESVKRNA